MGAVPGSGDPPGLGSDSTKYTSPPVQVLGPSPSPCSVPASADHILLTEGLPAHVCWGLKSHHGKLQNEEVPLGIQPLK